MIHLTEHFTLEELAHSDTALRLGIDNTPGATIVPHLITLTLGLEKIRALLERPLLVRSGYRCEALERLLCEKDFRAWCARRGRTGDGKDWREYFNAKAHPQGYAADFICPGFGEPPRIVRLIAGSAIEFDQLIEEGTWVHVSFDPRMRRNVLAATFGADGTPHYQLLPA